jgi:FkbM family methyltransferase
MKAKKLFTNFLSKMGYVLLKKESPYLRIAKGECHSFFDFIIARYLHSNGLNKQFHFLQIGAHDGQNKDPLAKYTDSCKWHGIMVEPIKSNFSRLSNKYQNNPNIKVVNCAVAWEQGYKPMYKVSEDCEKAPHWASMIASFSRDHLLNFKSKFPEIEKHIVIENVECNTIRNIISGHAGNDEINLVVIDTEGFDYQVILMLFKGNIEPSILHCEIAYMSPEEKSELFKMLENRRYCFAIEGRDLTAYKE